LREDGPLPQSYYRLLGVEPDASTDEIERSFKRLARRMHPDVNGGDGAAEERMKMLNQVRATLTNVEARARYDEQQRHEQREAVRKRQAATAARDAAASWAPARGASWMGAPARANGGGDRPRDDDDAPLDPEGTRVHVARVLWIAAGALAALVVAIAVIKVRWFVDGWR
jgi:curved DNA-binding protein CbpA